MLADWGTGQNSLQSKRHNRGLVVRQLLTGACSSRVELARAMGLSKMAMTNIVSDLVEQGFVEECEEKQTENCGRNPIRLQIAADAPRVVGLLVLRNRIEAVLCTLTLDIVKAETVTFLSLSEDQIPVYACEALDHLLAGESGVLAIGIARAVPVELRDFLEERYRLPVAQAGIGTSAALAEKLRGAGRGVENLVYVGLGDHIDCGIICGSTAYRSPRGIEPQLGHVCIDRNGPLCSCGGRGCLEIYAGTRVVLGKLCRAAGRRMRFVQFCRLSGVAEIEEIMAELVNNLASALAGAVQLLQPEMIVLGQDGLDWDGRHIQALEQAINHGGDMIPVRRAEFGRSAPLLGAAANVVDALCQGELL